MKIYETCCSSSPLLGIFTVLELANERVKITFTDLIRKWKMSGLMDTFQVVVLGFLASVAGRRYLTFRANSLPEMKITPQF